ncbi:hypothetical protein [Phenylobacterium sp.]|uniref:hypothetical protein n=1 Tax=Phenylobacterium sp. TaxID=1871053 RepID=UPI002730EB56|nr:hypothetical protein [Phenylobacterium sp.]MDP1598707.1 hypothetical protein [Phenylobacterium sp.]
MLGVSTDASFRSSAAFRAFKPEVRASSSGISIISFMNMSRARASLRSISASSRSIGARLARISLRSASACCWKSRSAPATARGASRWL